MRVRVFLASALLGSAAPVSAQRFEFVHQMLPPDRDEAIAVALGDLDGDGDLDRFRAIESAPPRIHLNDGTGVFTDLAPLVVLAGQGNARAVALGDVDGDGDLDAYVASTGQDQLYLSAGAGAFVNATAGNIPVQNDGTFAVALGDVDGDGDLDAYAGNYGQDRLYLNVGGGLFVDATPASLPPVGDPTIAVALGDVDGDGDLDAFAGNDGPDRLYLNVGAGVFALAPAASLPVVTDPTTSIALGDMDGDGDLDAYLGNAGSSVPAVAAQDRLYLNAGAGILADVTATNLPVFAGFTMSVALGDVDGDGDLDALLGQHGATVYGGQNRLYLNAAAGVFADATATNLPVQLLRTVGVALGDVDGDADLDAIATNITEPSFTFPSSPAYGQDRLLLNDGAGIFADVTSMNAGDRAVQTPVVALADVDGDGDLDAYAGDYPQDRLYLSGPGGELTDVTATNLPAVSVQKFAVAFGDVDGDGDVDALLGRAYINDPFVPQEPTRLYSNGGNGVFTDVILNLPAQLELEPTRAIALGDVDADGDLDAFVGKGATFSPSPGAQDRLFRNAGGGVFTDATAGNLPAVLADTRAVALGDVDADGDLDALVGRAVTGADRLLRNGGTGSFTDVTAGSLPALLGSTSACMLGDVDGDGDLDALVLKSGQSRMLFNGGTGVFADVTAASLPTLVDATTALALGEVDGDGDLDAFVTTVTNSNTGQTLVLLNGGTGILSVAPAGVLPVLSNYGTALALGDVEGDGDLDAFVGALGPERLYTNLLRQVSWRGIPRMGKPLTLDVDGPANGTWLLAASAGNASIPLPPFGTLRLFPPTLFFVAGGVLNLQGRASVTFPVPANPALVGQSLFWQAVVGPPLRFTNLEVTMVSNL